MDIHEIWNCGGVELLSSHVKVFIIGHACARTHTHTHTLYRLHEYLQTMEKIMETVVKDFFINMDRAAIFL